MSTTKIAVTGHCGAGKTTVVNLLRRRGYDAYSVAQEHSIISDLWAHQEPDVVVHLDVSLAEIRRRKRNPRWPEWIFDEQVRRLESARANATLVLDTDDVSAERIADEVHRYITERAAPGGTDE